ncbi:MAG: hypothetical protein KDB71_16975 [Mycobacterium sp.]|nr:hypothetical protein [Mycobacterium sp.]
MSKECRECLASQPHCHGTLIRHPGHRWQCTEPDCEHPEVLIHRLAVDCDAIGCEEPGCEEPGCEERCGDRRGEHLGEQRLAI